ncbi:MAG: winged helix-turn-helix transcriptional regulator [Bacteroidales bacterium]|nr:winged helix-turn-helix transcriptional regulator [Bacteroidales bacterium]
MNNIFKALNDPVRRQIIELLRDGDKNVGEIFENFTVTMPTLSHHLDILKRADLLTSEKKGQFVYYSLNLTVLDDVIHWLLQIKNK